MPDVVGVVPVVGRESLTSLELGGQSLLDRALTLLRRISRDVIEVTDADAEADLRSRLTQAQTVVVHDPLCPLVPERFVRSLLDRAARGSALAGARPVVDTVKATEDDAVVRTVDREQLRVICSPIVVAGGVLSEVPDLMSGLADPAGLVAALRGLGPVELVPAPSTARRVEDVSGLELTASMDAVAHRVRER